MKLETNELSLFGYDLGKSFSWLRSAWRELLWDVNSPLLRSMEEPVRLFDGESKGELGVFRGDRRLVESAHSVKTQAVCLSVDHYLYKSLQFPLSVEADLDEVMELELVANSPFPEMDSVMGWRVGRRSEGSINVDLVIAHKAEMRQVVSLIPNVDELWAKTPSGFVVMRGFSENLRRSRYLASLRVSAVKVVVILSLLCAMPAMVSGFRYMQMEKVQSQFHALKKDSALAVKTREDLGRANELMEKFNALLDEHPDPSQYIELLTEVADDDVWLRSFNLSGLRLQITGYAGNATEFIQQLAALPEFAQVKQRGGIRRDNASGSEVFTLDITLNSSHKPSEVD